MANGKTHRTGCYFCKGDHNIAHCPLREALLDLIKEFRLAKSTERESRSVRRESKSKTKGKSSSKDKYSKGKYASKKQSSRRDQGHAANDNDTSNTELESSSTSDADDSDSEVDEICHVSKAKNRKIPESCWCGDTGCTTYMTDQLNLFRGLLTKIKRRTIKVGGGKLYSDEIGTTEMKVAGVSLLLPNTLYVKGLGMNLLSSRKICSEWECFGIFNEDSMCPQITLHWRGGTDYLFFEQRRKTKPYVVYE
jgi:hypothetical protein